MTRCFVCETEIEGEPFFVGTEDCHQGCIERAAMLLDSVIPIAPEVAPIVEVEESIPYEALKEYIHVHLLEHTRQQTNAPAGSIYDTVYRFRKIDIEELRDFVEGLRKH